MQIGQTVRLFLTDSEEVPATIVALGGAGPSLRKELDLSYRAPGADGEDAQDVTVEGVLHEVDAEPGDPCWLMKGERRSVEPQDQEQEEDVGEEEAPAPDWPHAGLLEAGGFTTWPSIANASDDELLAVPGIAHGRLAEIRAYKPAK